MMSDKWIKCWIAIAKTDDQIISGRGITENECINDLKGYLRDCGDQILDENQYICSGDETEEIRNIEDDFQIFEAIVNENSIDEITGTSYWEEDF